MKSIFEFSSYRTYLNEWIRSHPKGGRGKKLQIARALNCNSAYVSFVFSGRADFSLEQASKLSHLMSLSEGEKDFLFLLVQLERAGTKDVKKYFQEKISALIETRKDLKNRLTYKKTLSREDQSTYYSSWLFSVVHMLVASSKFKTAESISDYLGISKRKVSQILEFLVSIGLVTEVKGAFSIGITSIHLERDSPLITKHHTNWRIQAIESLDRETTPNLHYSSVIMVSEQDAEKIQSILIQAIENIRSTVKASKEDRCFCYCIDLFPIR